MAKGKLVGRPNQPPPPDLEEARQTSDVASRRFTPDGKGSATAQPPPAGAGHTYDPANPYRYAKGRGSGQRR